MTYILSSLGAEPKPDPFVGVLATLKDPLTALVKDALAKNFTRYQAFNVFRFNDATLTDGKDKRLDTLLGRNKDGVMHRATPQYQLFEYTVVRAALALKQNFKPTGKQLRDEAYEIWKQIWAFIVPPTTGGGNAETQSTQDNTLLYVGVAAAIGLIAFGSMRRRS